MSEIGAALLPLAPSNDAGARSTALRSADGKANDAITIPPIDASNWRRVTSIVKF